ncbi:hypothetical protein [Schaedlerella arabinosiphila]|uniref:hypothetical protein n=1 Tax=Schaedlerella arabinosiphila TaxID=2044587 RepID=UPI0012F8335C|nr:hypothetical protein [Schaedlerella arabinosiphila]
MKDESAAGYVQMFHCISDTKTNTFYPLEDESKAQIEDYALETEYKDGNYEIAVKSVNETE